MKNIKINGIVSSLNMIVNLICKFILTRLIISNFGSELNGLVSLILQYLSLITLLDLGMGTVVQANLYKALTNKDEKMLSTIFYKSQSFFNNIGKALIVYIIGLAIFLSTTLKVGITQWEIVLLIISISISQFMRFFFGLTSGLIVIADQKGYIRDLLNIIPTILNLLLTYLIIKMNGSIVSVKFFSSLVFLAPPIILFIYVKKTYKISKDGVYKDYSFPQKWYGVSQHIAYTIQESTDSVLVSIFSTLENVSIYAVYNIVFSGIKGIIGSATSGIRPFLGNILYKESKEGLRIKFHRIEAILHLLIVLSFSAGLNLVSKLVILLTKDVADANYYQPIFAYIMGLATMFFCLNILYKSMIIASGKFKETQYGAIFEAILNFTVSIFLVGKFGIVGVAIGTLLSLMFSFTFYSYSAYKLILEESYLNLFRQHFTNILIILISNIIILNINIQVSNIMQLIIFGVISLIIAALVSFLVNILINRKNLNLIKN